MNTSKTKKLHWLVSTPARVKSASLALALLTLGLAAQAQDADARQPLLPSPLCDSVQVPEGSVMAFHAYAIGLQIYRWTGTTWVFVAPQAKLYADAGYHGQVGTHFAGPTWESNSGSQVLGVRIASCTPDPNSIAWLKLAGISTQGPGIFDGVAFVQRVNTVGGTAPASPGTTVDELAGVPYAAEYFFYRTQD